MKKILSVLLLFTLVFSLAACGEDDDNNGATGSGRIIVEEEEFCKDLNNTYDYESLDYQLVWSDEFDGDTLDTTVWTHEIGGDGWGNNELQFYTDSARNSYVNNGSLFIRMIKETYQANSYTSARLVTKDNQDFTYGIFEMRAKIPVGKGTWAAFWLMPTDSYYGVWPDSGEIDIMEHVGYDLGNIHHSIHTEFFNHKENTQKGGSETHENVDTEFHTYALEWLPDKLIYTVDDEVIYTYDANQFDCVKKGHWPFDKDFFIILNLAFGGFWGAAQGIDPEVSDATFEIDYVRVYQDSTISE